MWLLCGSIYTSGPATPSSDETPLGAATESEVIVQQAIDLRDILSQEEHLKKVVYER